MAQYHAIDLPRDSSDDYSELSHERVRRSGENDTGGEKPRRHAILTPSPTADDKEGLSDADVLEDDWAASESENEHVRSGTAPDRRGVFARLGSFLRSSGRPKVSRQQYELVERDGDDTQESSRRKKNRRKKQKRRRGGRRDRRAAPSSSYRDDDSEPVFDMEEGPHTVYTPPSSSEEDHEEVRRPGKRRKSTKRKRGFFNLMKQHVVFRHMVLCMLLVAAGYGAYKLSGASKGRKVAPLLAESDYSAKSLWNGTTSFAPTTILVSLDGFRADFLQRGLTPNLNQLIVQGVSPQYMLPSFPSLTFPNHYTLVTGLYPESHGIVGNSFWDPDLSDEFYYTDRAHSMVPKWWTAEPLWVTAEEQGVRTAIHMWPGSEAHIPPIEPTHVDKYNGKELLSNKVRNILNWIDTPGPDSPHAKEQNPRPQLIAAYVPDVDRDGHGYGPNSTEIRDTIRAADDMMGQLLHGLQERNLTEIVNVIVVSDHGMATTSNQRLIQLEDLIDVSLIEHTDGWPLYGLRPKDPNDLMALHTQLKVKTANMPYVDVYLRDLDMPPRWHFSANPRIAPLWIVPHAGWAIVTRDELDIAESERTGAIYQPRGLHGYDHEHPLMRAIFLARGPAFPHSPGTRIAPFQNENVYNLVCDSLGIRPRSNNGTLRLPLQTIIGHVDDPGLGNVNDPGDLSPIGTGTPVEGADDAGAFINPVPIPPSMPAVATPTPGSSNNAGEDVDPVVDNLLEGEGFSEEEKEEIEGWLAWIKSQYEKVKQGFANAWDHVTGRPQNPDTGADGDNSGDSSD